MTPEQLMEIIKKQNDALILIMNCLHNLGFDHVEAGEIEVQLEEIRDDLKKIKNEN